MKVVEVSFEIVRSPSAGSTIAALVVLRRFMDALVSFQVFLEDEPGLTELLWALVLLFSVGSFVITGLLSATKNR